MTSPRSLCPTASLGVEARTDRRRGTLVLLTTLLLALGSAALASTANAYQPGLPDPAAPKGADSQWLPADDWVQRRWLPYSEATLSKVLDTDRYELGPWLRPGHRDLADLAHEKGISPTKAVRRVMAPERARVSARQYRVLTRRARRTFTQRHLMQHMLFHNFHTGPANGAWPRAIGLSWPEIGRRRNAHHLSLWQVAERNGKDPEHVLEVVRAAIASNTREGIRRHATSRTQALAWQRRDMAALASYAKWPAGGRVSLAQASAADLRPRRGQDAAASFSAICVLH